MKTATNKTVQSKIDVYSSALLIGICLRCSNFCHFSLVLFFVAGSLHHNSCRYQRLVDNFESHFFEEHSFFGSVVVDVAVVAVVVVVGVVVVVVVLIV